jgi:hypothetical protein
MDEHKRLETEMTVQILFTDKIENILRIFDQSLVEHRTNILGYERVHTVLSL